VIRRRGHRRTMDRRSRTRWRADFDSLFRKDVDHQTAIEAEDGIAVQDVLRLTAWVNCADAGITIEPIWSAVPDDRFSVS
jgi:hypothetical protein